MDDHAENQGGTHHLDENYLHKKHVVPSKLLSDSGTKHDKLIVGLPNCSLRPEKTGDGCPDGWVHLNGTIEPPPYTPSFTWLFNIKEDPNERKNLASEYPEIVKQLKERLEYYNSTHIEQLDPLHDPKSNPANFGGVWTPWLD